VLSFVEGKNAFFCMCPKHKVIHKHVKQKEMTEDISFYGYFKVLYDIPDVQIWRFQAM
jgi:hypothetical protein